MKKKKKGGGGVRCSAGARSGVEGQRPIGVGVGVEGYILLTESWLHDE